jgi:hypothetical protein
MIVSMSAEQKEIYDSMCEVIRDPGDIRVAVLSGPPVGGMTFTFDQVCRTLNLEDDDKVHDGADIEKYMNADWSKTIRVFYLNLRTNQQKAALDDTVRFIDKMKHPYKFIVVISRYSPNDSMNPSESMTVSYL